MSATSPWIELPSPPRRGDALRRYADGLGSLLVGILVGALALSALRVHVTDLRYRRAEALQQEQQLEDEQRRLAVEVQAAKDPMRLQELARAQGFVTPERVITLSPGRGVAGARERAFADARARERAR